MPKAKSKTIREESAIDSHDDGLSQTPPITVFLQKKGHKARKKKGYTSENLDAVIRSKKGNEPPTKMLKLHVKGKEVASAHAVDTATTKPSEDMENVCARGMFRKQKPFSWPATYSKKQSGRR